MTVCPSSASALCVLPRPRILLLDRDGTLIDDRHYLSDPDGVTLLPGVGEALARLTALGCRLFMVSNQSGVGRGFFPESLVRACQARLDELLAAHHVRLEDAVWCPHAPEEGCACRKPAPGLWRLLAERYNLRAEDAWMVGDKVDDLGLADQAELALGVLTLTGKGRDHAAKAGLELPTESEPLHLAPDGRRGVVRDLAGLAAAVEACGVRA